MNIYSTQTSRLTSTVPFLSALFSPQRPPALMLRPRSVIVDILCVCEKVYIISSASANSYVFFIQLFTPPETIYVQADPPVMPAPLSLGTSVPSTSCTALCFKFIFIKAPQK